MTQPTSVNGKVRTIMAKVSRVDLTELEDDIRFREEMGVDSLMAMEIVATCEKRLSIVLDETELARLETIGEFVAYVNDVFERTHGSPQP